MLVIFGLVLIDVTVLTIYTVLEGAITHFSVGTESNKERQRAAYGVS